MHHFDSIDGALHAEAVPLETLADAVGTPAYVYSTATLTRHYGLLAEAVEAHRGALGEALIAFAVKANSNQSVLATLARLGCGADTVSAPQPSRARVASTDRLELALTAKAISAAPSEGRCASTASRNRP